MKHQSYFDLVYYVTQKIPKGRVTNYGAIAAHRVVNRKGELSGRVHFKTPTLMQELLESEGVEVINNKIPNFDELFWHPEALDDD